jgi:fucose permease
MTASRVRFATIACYVTFVSLGMSGTLLGPAFQSLTSRFEIPLESGGLFTMLQFLGVTIGVVIAGRLLDRFNARYLLSGGVILMGGGLLLIGAAEVLPIALGGALLLGLGYGTLDVSPNVVIATLNPTRASAALNLLNVFYGIGAVFGPQVLSFALARENFALAFNLIALFTLALAVPLFMVSLHVRAESGGAVRGRIRWIALAPFAVLLFLYVGAEVGFSSWIFTQMTMVSLSVTATAALGASIFWAGLTAGRAIASLLLRWLSDEQLLLASVLLLSASVGMLLLFPTAEGVALISAFLAGVGCGPVFPTVIAIVNNRYPAARGTASGALIAVGTLGAAILPWMQGQVGAGQNGGMIMVLAVAVLMSVLLMGVERIARAGRAT